MPVENRLLGALPRKTFESVRTECEFVELRTGDVLGEPGARIREVYFPTESFVSLVAKAAGGASLEVALVGHEGMVGIQLLLGADTNSLRVLVQRSGCAWRMRAETFKRMTDTIPLLRHALNQYALLRLAQVAQNAICASAHQIEARLARRLLMMRDRSHSDQFHATQESLASMLGVRRSSVCVAAKRFQRNNLIEYNRGTPITFNRQGLEKISCECYWASADRRSRNTS
jgi:CRP-like cAMP-binding protein